MLQITVLWLERCPVNSLAEAAFTRASDVQSWGVVRVSPNTHFNIKIFVPRTLNAYHNTAKNRSISKGEDTPGL